MGVCIQSLARGRWAKSLITDWVSRAAIMLNCKLVGHITATFNINDSITSRPVDLLSAEVCYQNNKLGLRVSSRSSLEY